MNRPLVSVVIPAYNADKYIQKSLGSIINQSYKNLEIVVINDCSTDNTVREINKFNDPRIRLLHNERNLGLAGVRNRALKEITGDFLAWLDADDYSVSERIQKQVDYFKNNPSLGICASWIKQFGDKNSTTKFPSFNDDIKVAMLFNNCFATSAVMVRTDIFKKNRIIFNHDFPPAEDYDFWHNILKYSEGAIIPECLSFYRSHAEQTTKNDPKAKSRRKVQRHLQGELSEALGITSSENEITLHLKVGARRIYNLNADEMSICKNWFEKLISHNKDKSFFKQKSLENKLNELWYLICYSSDISNAINLNAFGPVSLAKKLKYSLKKLK